MKKTDNCNNCGHVRVIHFLFEGCQQKSKAEPKGCACNEFEEPRPALKRQCQDGKKGWHCTRDDGHKGPHALVPISDVPLVLFRATEDIQKGDAVILDPRNGDVRKVRLDDVPTS